VSTLTILRVPVISTAHVSESDMERLTDRIRSTDYPGAAYDEGCWLWIPLHEGDGDDMDDDPIYNDLKINVAIVEWARKNQFPYVRLDRDGDEIGDLPTYDW